MNLKKSCLLLIYCFFLIIISPLSSYGTEYENFIVIGGFMPVDSDEGLFTPLIYWDHNTEDYPLNGALNIKLETSTLTARMEHEIPWTHIYLGYGVKGTALSESLGTDIYQNGEMLEQYTYDGSSASFLLSARYEFTKKWDITYQYQYKKAWFDTNDDTSSTFVLPPDYKADIHSIKLAHKGSFFGKKGEFEVTFIQGYRDDLANWTLDSTSISKDDYNKQTFKWKIPIDYTKKNKGELVLSGGNGYNLDVLTDFGVGGLASQYTAAGFYRYEFRAKKILSGNFSHEYHFTKNRRLLLYADLLYFESIDLSNVNNSDKDQTIGSLGAGFYYGIESLGGLPIIIRYGEGLNVDSSSKESHRREVMLLIVAGF
ncbi:MAG: hypothetical protein GY714_02585 [Desulfobacterales bacterium]|nr:hypothetical protein [Desulfobacterales bacterium]